MELTFLIVFGLVTTILSVFVYSYVSSGFRARKTRKHFDKGFCAEHQAQSFLRKHGFTILATQPVVKGTMWLDDQAQTYTVRADYLVKKGGRKSLVEVKSGEVANPKQRYTRRQLFEYLHLYRVDTLYLFDAQQKRLIRIRFSKQMAYPTRQRIVHFALGALCTLLMVYFWDAN